MKVTHLNSATEIITVNGIKILTDPWLDDGIYYGSWYIYPPYNQSHTLLEDIDYVYISHIHPDHFCEKSMKRLSKNVKILIHNYEDKSLRRKIEMLGFSSIIELNNNERILLENQVYINIFAADNCNPEICGKAFGCFFPSATLGKTNQIDSMCVIDNEKYVLVNTNDCPYPIAYEALTRIVQQYPQIDFLLVGYAGASLYPYAMSDYSETEMFTAQQQTKQRGLNMATKIINKINPRFFMPFAGTYVLGGANWKLNKYSPIPELENAANYFKQELSTNGQNCQPVLLNSGETFDLTTETQTNDYIPSNSKDKWQYIQNELSSKKYTFDDDMEVSLDDIMLLIPDAIKRFHYKRNAVNFQTQTTILINLPENKLLKICCSGNNSGFDIIQKSLANWIEPFIYFDINFKLLHRILKGPKYAHWNNVEIGALLKMIRKPDKYEMGIHMMLCYLHV
ncbi:hypothetical protein FEM33_02770 [Dyadobacter flavalbus]|uniref:MBL fold metallo-hydrolase n=1 Tax=Dyadobacter flavalbus TaxID=2579942 RepID=A0A5M8QYH9_9BACT|nr:MBL fold metallo-hydrolase [Dyadobacter flavalbus]KAA6441249.1 hypothetical protein FEM33_02770 [Dyadobacter flavalbus]